MVVKICPRCNTRYTIGFGVTDFVHECNSGNTTLDQEDVVITGDWEDYTGSGIELNPLVLGAANKLWGTRAAIEGERTGELTDRGANADTHRQRQHLEWIDIEGGESI